MKLIPHDEQYADMDDFVQTTHFDVETSPGEVPGVPDPDGDDGRE